MTLTHGVAKEPLQTKETNLTQLARLGCLPAVLASKSAMSTRFKVRLFVLQSASFLDGASPGPRNHASFDAVAPIGCSAFVSDLFQSHQVGGSRGDAQIFAFARGFCWKMACFKVRLLPLVASETPATCKVGFSQARVVSAILTKQFARGWGPSFNR